MRDYEIKEASLSRLLKVVMQKSEHMCNAGKK